MDLGGEKANILCTHLQVDMNYKIKDNHATVHKPREAKYQRGLKRSHMDFPEKRKWISWVD